MAPFFFRVLGTVGFSGVKPEPEPEKPEISGYRTRTRTRKFGCAPEPTPEPEKPENSGILEIYACFHMNSSKLTLSFSFIHLNRINSLIK